MDREEFISMTGEDPVDMFGSDWKNEVDDILNKGIINPCQDCGVEVDNLDNEICEDCWIKFEERMAGYRSKGNNEPLVNGYIQVVS